MSEKGLATKRQYPPLRGELNRCPHCRHLVRGPCLVCKMRKSNGKA